MPYTSIHASTRTCMGFSSVGYGSRTSPSSLSLSSQLRVHTKESHDASCAAPCSMSSNLNLLSAFNAPTPNQRRRKEEIPELNCPIDAVRAVRAVTWCCVQELRRTALSIPRLGSPQHACTSLKDGFEDRRAPEG